MENLLLMMAPLFSSKLLLVLFFGTLFGLILGVLPGLGPTTGGALILPFTMTLDPLSAVVLSANDIERSITYHAPIADDVRDPRCGALLCRLQIPYEEYGLALPPPLLTLVGDLTIIILVHTLILLIRFNLTYTFLQKLIM